VTLTRVAPAARAIRAINFIQMDRFERLYIYHNYTRVAAQRW